MARGAQVAGLTVDTQFHGRFQQLFCIFIQQLATVLPPATPIPAAYDSGSDEEQAFIQNLAIFFTAFFRVGCMPGGASAHHQWWLLLL